MVAISEISNRSRYRNVMELNFLFSDEKRSKSSEYLSMEPGPSHYFTDDVKAMNPLIPEIHNHRENCVTVKVSRRTQKVEIFLANERSGLAFFSTDLGTISEVMLSLFLE